MCFKVIAVYHICMAYMSTSIGDVTNTCNSSFVLKVSECCLYSGYCENIAFIADFEDRDVQFFQRVSILLLFLTDYHYRDIIFNFRISFLSMSTNGYLRKVLQRSPNPSSCCLTSRNACKRVARHRLPNCMHYVFIPYLINTWMLSVELRCKDFWLSCQACSW